MLPGRSDDIYEEMFGVILNHVSQRPKSITIDFEKAVENVIKRRLPVTDVHDSIIGRISLTATNNINDKEWWRAVHETRCLGDYFSVTEPTVSIYKKNLFPQREVVSFENLEIQVSQPLRKQKRCATIKNSFGDSRIFKIKPIEK